MCVRPTFGLVKERNSTWYPKQPFVYCCFNWMIPNLYLGNSCLTSSIHLKSWLFRFAGADVCYLHARVDLDSWKPLATFAPTIPRPRLSSLYNQKKTWGRRFKDRSATQFHPSPSINPRLVKKIPITSINPETKQKTLGKSKKFLGKRPPQSWNHELGNPMAPSFPENTLDQRFPDWQDKQDWHNWKDGDSRNGTTRVS